MDRIYTKAREGSPSASKEVHSDNDVYSADNEEMFSEVDESQSRPATPTPRPSSAQAHLSFFNQPHHPQQVQMTFEPAVLLLWAAMVQELRTQNAIALTKMKHEEELKQQELEAAQKAEEAAREREEEDQRKFAELKASLYM